jgi:outer membrane protein assembly factor BamB
VIVSALIVVAGLAIVLAGLLTGLTVVGKTAFDERHEEDPRLVQEATQALAEVTPGPAPAARGTDWPQWRGPLRDGISRETDVRTDWPADGLPKLWEAPIGPGYSSVVAADGRAITMTADDRTESVICWDAATGQEKWRHTYDRPGEAGFGGYGPGPRSTPTIDGDRVFSVGGTAILHCLETATGKVVWWKDLVAEFGGRVPNWGVAFSPLVEGELLLTMPGGSNGSSVVALDKRTGGVVWKNLSDAPGYSSPIAATLAGWRQVVCFTGEAVVGVQPGDGRELWRYPWQTNYNCNIATPIVSGDYVYVSSDYGKGCALLKIAADANQLSARRVYENNKMRNHFGTSVLVDRHLYGFDESGYLVCMEFATGQVAWRERGFNKGSLLAVGGQLVILGENGKLALADATPKAYHERASFRASHERCWTMPTLADGRLYVRDETRLVCYDVRKK